MKRVSKSTFIFFIGAVVLRLLVKVSIRIVAGVRVRIFRGKIRRSKLATTFG